ncbi:MAG: glycosyltransferase [Candidatus Aenigmatarchaeota archaeon]
MNKPLVSVIMPVYNASEFLDNAITSIIKQTYQNFEFIIIDDASVDNSWQIIQKYKKLYPDKIKAFHLKRNLNRGGDACFNIGLKYARGKYIARMDADDIAHPQRLEKQVKFLEKNSHVFLVGASAYVIDQQGKKIGEKIMPIHHEDIFSEYVIFHPIIHSTIMFRNHIIKRVNFYRQYFSSNNDYYTLFELINKGYRFENLPDKLVYYRIHSRNDSLRNIKRSFFNTLKARVLIIKKYHYPLKASQFIKNILQLLLIIILPEKFILTLYLLSRGIIKKENIVKKIKKSFLAPFSTLIKKEKLSVAPR